MEFQQIDASGAYLIEMRVLEDARGSFARTWCDTLFQNAGIAFVPRQSNVSTTRQRRSIRGMHFQRAPFEDPKLVRCSVGCIFDVIVDMRRGSATCGRIYENELSKDNGRMLFIPGGFAHGFQTLTDNVTVEYMMGAAYRPDYYDGFRYDDPQFKIRWPLDVGAISDNDLAWPPVDPQFCYF